MMQAKLSEEQMRQAILAKRRSEKLVGFLRCHNSEAYQTILEVDQAIAQMICHGTSDGKPYVDPEPPIPEGWRKALDNEHCRKDVKLWDKDKKQWAKRLFPSQPFLNGDRYIVPIDPPLTDEDACVWPRLLVMVRDDEIEEWHGPYRYLGKNDYYPYPYIVDPDGMNSRTWKRARRATPEEIEAAK